MSSIETGISSWSQAGGQLLAGEAWLDLSQRAHHLLGRAAGSGVSQLHKTIVAAVNLGQNC